MGYTHRFSKVFHPGSLSKKERLQNELTALQTANCALEQELLIKDQVLENVSKTTELLQAENMLLYDGHNIESGGLSHSNETANLRRQIETLKNELHESKETQKTSSEQVSLLNRQIDAQIKERESGHFQYNILSSINEKLRQDLLESEAVVIAARNEKQDLEARLEAVEDIATWSSRRTGNDVKVIITEHATLTATNKRITETLEASEKMVSDLDAQLRQLWTQYLELHASHEALQQEVSCLRSNQSKTIREVLTIRILAISSTPSLELIKYGVDDEWDEAGWNPHALVPRDLDAVLSPEELQQVLKELPRDTSCNSFYCRLKHQACRMCRRMKFDFDARLPSEQHLMWINEFPPSNAFVQCCGEMICSACAVFGLEQSISMDWWHDLDSDQWLKCPFSGCGEALRIRHSEDLTVYIKQLGGHDEQKYLKMYQRAECFREGLQSLDPQPTPEALLISSSLHNHLVQWNRMHSPFDQIFDEGPIQNLEPGSITYGELRDDLLIPIFTVLMRRQSTPKECIACSDEKFEIDYGNEDEWKVICENFNGPWMWALLEYPTKSMVENCDHDFTMCKECVARYLESSLDDGGCDKLSCPECRTQFQHKEVKLLAAPHTFEKFEKMLLRKALSAEPNFRWCLREGCNSGQIYDIENEPDQCIICEDCAFKMCFSHQMKWHRGLSCAEFDSIREHGDPQYQQTRQWMEQNTKQCPGCNLNIEKDEGCFHMTCQRCDFEFCWECLADWKNIGQDDGEQVASNHKKGCFFRSGVRATAIHGNDLNEALRVREVGLL